MVIKTLEYKVLDNISPTKILEEKSISFEVAEKAKYLVHHALRISTINGAQYTSSTKTKSEVRGGGRKPWKQKGTGRARAGSNRSPLWRGGGVIFGPKTKNKTRKINKKEKQLALRTVLYNKKDNITIFNNFEINEAKTANVIEKLTNANPNFNEKSLIISSKPNKNLKLSLQNLQNCEYILADQLNVRSLVKAQQIFADETSLQIIQETYGSKK
jgi:large subunit ribosomal protein L4